MTVRRFGKGYIPDTHDKSKDLTTRHLFGARRLALAGAASLEQFVDHARDQVQTSACTGFAFARAVHVRCAAMGRPIPWPAQLGVYTVGRMADPDFQPPLQDQGAMPSSVVAGLQQWGVAQDADWPPGGWDAVAANDPTLAAYIDEKPTLLELEEAAHFVVQGSYRISSDGAARLADVQQAIAEGYPVAVGTNVDQAFEDYAGGKAVDGTLNAVSAPDPAKILGGHMMCLVGYGPDPASPRRMLYRGVNSWGPAWGDHGLYWADETFVTSDQMTDLYVVTVAPTNTGLAARARAMMGR